MVGQDRPRAKDYSRQDSQSSDISQKQSVRPTVHYPEELDHAPSAQYFNTAPKLQSRAPSFAGTDEDDDEDKFDWSGDEDLADEEAKFGQQMGVNLRAKRWTIWRVFTILFSSLIGSTFLASILVAPALLVHFLWYKPHPTSYRHYVDQNIEAWLFWAAANVVISWGLAMIIDIVPTITRILISVSWGHVSEEVKSHIELYDSVKDTFKPVLYAASAWLSWIILFQNIFKLYDGAANGTSFAPYTDRIAQAIEFLFFLVLVVYSQRMLSHFVGMEEFPSTSELSSFSSVAFAFHRTAYKERLEEVKCGLRIIEKLREYKPRTRHHNNRSSGGHGVFNLGFVYPFGEKGSNHRQRGDSISQGYDGGNDADAEDNKGKGKQRPPGLRASIQPHDIAPDSPELEDSKTPATHPAFSPSHENQDVFYEYPPSRKHMYQQEEHNPAIQAARAIKSAVLHDARNITGNDDDLSGLRFSVTSAHEAKRLARAIYKTFRDRHRTYLISADFQPAFATSGEAQEAFRVFDKDNNGDISRSEIKAAVLRIYKERRFLSRSMRDVGVALGTLDQILLLFAFVILFFISLSVFGVNINQLLTSVYSLGIAASFVFKNAASSMFDAVMFLFITHPFDTGDRCFIDTDNLIVKKMGLFATVFVRSDGTETYFSNSQLFTKFITNKMVESLTMQVAWRTPLEKLDALEARLNEWLAVEENRWFQPTTSIILQNISFQRHLEITIGIPHNSTWQDWGLRNARRTAFHAAVQYYCRQLGITAYASPMSLAYLDSDTQQYTPVISETERRAQDRSDGIEGSTKNFLGFTPPDQRGSQLRARKSKSRKAVLRGTVLVAATSKAMSVADLHDLELIWPSSRPTNVIATGTFDQWSSSIHLVKDDIGFVGTVKVPWGQKVAYKFIVDGRWQCRDDRPQENDGYGNINNVLRTPEKPQARFPAVYDPPARLSIPLEGAQSQGYGDVETMVTAVEFHPPAEPAVVKGSLPLPIPQITVEGLSLAPSARTPDTAAATEGNISPTLETSAGLAPFKQEPSSSSVSTLPINDNDSISLPPVNGNGETHDSYSFATHAPIQFTIGEPLASPSVPETSEAVSAPFESAASQPNHSPQAAQDALALTGRVDVPPTPTPAAVLDPTAKQPRVDLESAAQSHPRQDTVPASIGRASTASTPGSSTLTPKKRRSLLARIKHIFDKDSDKRERKEKNNR
ncbi:Mechanosensitive ion channel-domain-containing protein [Lanmaoa asiatica]|nr:Mechanosensitive ion channel-domain-containing protein [Lanmaoa asiatica]